MVNSTEALIYPAYVLLSCIEDIMLNPAKLDVITAHYPTKISIEDYRNMHNI
jgi:hypothetical protein